MPRSGLVRFFMKFFELHHHHDYGTRTPHFTHVRGNVQEFLVEDSRGRPKFEEVDQSSRVHLGGIARRRIPKTGTGFVSLSE